MLTALNIYSMQHDLQFTHGGMSAHMYTHLSCAKPMYASLLIAPAHDAPQALQLTKERELRDIADTLAALRDIADKLAAEQQARMFLF